MDLSAGAQSLGSMVYSEGGGAAGVDVTMVGTAIESGLLAIQCVEYRGWTSAVAVRTAEDGTCLVAQFPTSGVPAASGVVYGTETEPNVVDNRPSLALSIQVIPHRHGEGTLEVRVEPTEPPGPPAVERWKVTVH